MGLWDKFVAKAKDIDAWRKLHLSAAEMIDAWRIIPRVIAGVYFYMCYKLFVWYQSLEPYMIEGCDIEILKEKCIAQAPNSEHMAFATAVFAVSAAVFGLYSRSGKTWNGFTPWNSKNIVEYQIAKAPHLDGGRRASDPAPIEKGRGE